ncbi:mRNA-capping enzyme subunit beta [Cladochytrium tenue]|nr:mRNA-capping enzyme subunit beta [Cladochytrium tenue]
MSAQTHRHHGGGGGPDGAARVGSSGGGGGAAGRDGLHAYVVEWVAGIMADVVSADPDVLQGRAAVEVEAKLGIILDKQRGTRLSLPIVTETALNDSMTQYIRFDAGMTMNQHAMFNQLLNKDVEASRGDVKYSHRYEIDEFFQARGGPKVRVTTNKKSKECLATIEKRRIGDLHLYFPRHPLDCRISINLEINRGKPATGRKSHELEVEIRPDVDVREESLRFASQRPSQLPGAVGALLAAVRRLSASEAAGGASRSLTGSIGGHGSVGGGGSGGHHASGNSGGGGGGARKRSHDEVNPSDG